MAEQEIVLKADGLWTNPNALTAPQGGMSQANNVVSIRPGLVESRRGFNTFGDATGTVNAMFVYQNTVVAHYGADKLTRFDSGGVKTEYSGSYPPPTGQTIQPSLDQDSLYFLTSKGLHVLEGVSSTPKIAGLTPPVVLLDPLTYAIGSFLAQNETVAYRAVLGYRNTSGRIILSGPSDSRLFTNPSATPCGVELSFGAVGTLTTSHFIQIYRTRKVEGAQPGEEFYLVLERSLSSSEASGSAINFKDIVPDELLGPPLYTNPSQESMLRANEQPPLAATICPFAGSLLYGNTQGIHRKILRMMTVPAEGDTITIGGTVYTAKASPTANTTDYQRITTGTVSEQIRKTAMNLCLEINGGGGVARGNVLARYISGPFDAPGQILLERPDVSYGVFAITAGTSAAGALWNPQLPTSGTSVSSDSDKRPHGLYISKPNEPEAAPVANRYDIGTLANDLQMVASLAGSAFVFKERDGLWRITGDAINGLSIDLFDSTVELVAPRTVVALDNTLFALTRKGVVRISEAGVSEPISLAIEDQILSLFGSALSAVQGTAHAVAYESEGLYVLWLPSSSSDTTATQAFVYSVRSGGWTRWTKPATAAMVHPDEDKLYVGVPGGSVSVERKLRLASDHQDEAGTAIDVTVAWRPITGESPATQKRWREVSLFLQGDSTNEIEAAYETDIGTSLLPLAVRLPVSLETSALDHRVTVSTSGVATGIVRMPVPLDKCRASRMIFTLRHSKAGQKLSCSGLAVLMRTVSARVRK